MKAVVWQAPGQIDLEEVPDARIEHPGDAVVRLTMSAICGTDLHMVRGTMPGMVPGTVLGHENVGVVEAVGDNVRAFVPGDRVVIPSTICCGTCVYCRAGSTSQCDNANPNVPDAGTSFFGGPESTGPVNGLQASFARIPFAAANLIPLPDAVTDEQAIVHLAVKMGNCPHRAIIPQLVDLVASGAADPAQLLTQVEPIDDVVSAYRTFDTREPGWVKVALAPVA